MLQNKKFKIAIAIIATILLVLAIIIVWIKGKNSNIDSDTTQSNIYNIDIVGTWYSNRTDNDILTLKNDDTYSSSAWLAAGTYRVDNNIVYLTDNYGTTKELTISTDNESSNSILYFDNENYSHTYFRTQEEAENSKTKEESSNTEQLQEYYNDAATKILIADWISGDKSTDMKITEDKIIVNFKGVTVNGTTTGAETTTYSYTIINVEQNNNSYNITWKMTDEKGITSTVDDVVITENSSGSYSIFSRSFPYGLYSYDRVTPLETSDTSSTEEVSTNEKSPTLPENTSKPSITNTTTTTNQLSREDNPNESDFISEVNTAVEKSIIGTWLGWFDDTPNENTVYWKYVFNDDGTYTFSHDNYSESGTYTVTHDNENKTYPHTIIMKHGEETTEQKFYIYGSDTYTIVTEAEDDPTYIKQ